LYQNTLNYIKIYKISSNYMGLNILQDHVNDRGDKIGWLVGWLVGLLGCLVDWLGWLVEWLAGWLIGWLIGWFTSTFCYQNDGRNINTHFNIIKKVSRNRLSEFEEFSPCCPRSNCFPAVMDPDNTNEFLSIDNIDKLFTILIANLYTIDYNLSKLLMKSQVEIPNLICFIRK